VDRAGPEDERHAGGDQRPHDRAHARDADASRRLVSALEHHQGEFTLADLCGGDEREAVPGRTEHEVEGSVGDERVDQWRRIGTEFRGAKARLEQRLSGVEDAQIERDRPRIDPCDARAQLRLQAQPSSFAIA